MKDYVKMLCENSGLKFLIFGYHHLMLDGIVEQLNSNQVEFIRIDGKTAQADRPVSYFSNKSV